MQLWDQMELEKVPWLILLQEKKNMRLAKELLS